MHFGFAVKGPFDEVELLFALFDLKLCDLCGGIGESTSAARKNDLAVGDIGYLYVKLRFLKVSFAA